MYVAGDYARAKEIFLEAGNVLTLPFLTELTLFIYLFISHCLFIFFLLRIFLTFHYRFFFCHLFLTFLHHTSLPFMVMIVGVEADCVEGLYNLGLVNLKLNAEQEAHNAFDKLHTILPRYLRTHARTHSSILTFYCFLINPDSFAILIVRLLVCHSAPLCLTALLHHFISHHFISHQLHHIKSNNMTSHHITLYYITSITSLHIT